MSVSHRTWIGTFATNGAVVLLGTATGILAARLLLPAGRGVLAVMLFWPQIIMGVGIFGLKEAVTFRMCGAPEGRDRAFAAACWMALGYAALSCIAAWFLLPVLLGQARADIVNITFSYTLFTLPCFFVALVLRSADQGLLNFRAYNLLLLAPPLIYFLGLLAIWAAGAFSAENAVWANMCSVIVVTMVRLIQHRRIWQVKPSWREMKGLMRKGLGFHATIVLGMLSSQVDRLAVISLWDNAAVGMYVVAWTVAASSLSALSSSFQTIVFPSMGRLREQEEKRKYLGKWLRHAMLLLVLACLSLMTATHWLVPLFFGEAYGRAVGVANVLLMAYVPLVLRQVMISALRGVGEARSATMSELVVLLGFIATVPALASQLGIAGVAVALLVSQVVSLAYLERVIRARFELAWSDWWGLNRDTVLELLSGLWCYIASIRGTAEAK